MKVRGKVFVVTGAGAGIGRQVVLKLLRGGGRVAAVDLRPAGLDELVTLARAGERLSTHTVDVGNRDAVAGLVDEVLAAHGQVDGLLNVAGIIQPFVPLADLEYEQIEHVMQVNFWGVVHTVKAFLPELTGRPAACVVNVSSMGGFCPVPGQSGYGASKAAVKLLTEGLYAELRGGPVAVTVVFPGAIATGITANSGVEAPRPTGDPASMKLTSPEDAADIIVRKAVRQGRYRVMVGKDATLLDRLSRLAPRRATDLIATKMKHLLG